MQASIFSHSGEHLCDAELQQPGQPDELMVAPAGETGQALFTYYFFRSGRHVTVVVGDVRFPAMLRTRWRDNKRVWWVEPQAEPPVEPEPQRATPAEPPAQHRPVNRLAQLA